MGSKNPVLTILKLEVYPANMPFKAQWSQCTHPGSFKGFLATLFCKLSHRGNCPATEVVTVRCQSSGTHHFPLTDWAKTLDVSIKLFGNIHITFLFFLPKSYFCMCMSDLSACMYVCCWLFFAHLCLVNLKEIIHNLSYLVNPKFYP